MKKKKFSAGRFGEMKSLVSGLGWWAGAGASCWWWGVHSLRQASLDPAGQGPLDGP